MKFWFYTATEAWQYCPELRNLPGKKRWFLRARIGARANENETDHTYIIHKKIIEKIIIHTRKKGIERSRIRASSRNLNSTDNGHSRKICFINTSIRVCKGVCSTEACTRVALRSNALVEVKTIGFVSNTL